MTASIKEQSDDDDSDIHNDFKATGQRRVLWLAKVDDIPETRHNVEILLILVINGLFTQQISHILRHMQRQYLLVLCCEKNLGMVLLVFNVTF